MKFNDVLKKLRTEKDISQRTLAKNLDIQPTAVSAYERGEKLPTVENLIKIADFFGVSTDMLLGIKPPKEENKYTYLSGCIPLIKALIEEYSFSWDPENECFWTGDDRIKRLMNDWDNLYSLNQKGTITKDLYDLWLKDQYEKNKTVRTDGLDDDLPPTPDSWQNSSDETDDFPF